MLMLPLWHSNDPWSSLRGDREQISRYRNCKNRSILVKKIYRTILFLIIDIHDCKKKKITSLTFLSSGYIIWNSNNWRFSPKQKYTNTAFKKGTTKHILPWLPQVTMKLLIAIHFFQNKLAKDGNSTGYAQYQRLYITTKCL